MNFGSVLIDFMIFAPPAPLISFIDSGSYCHVYKFYESWIGADPFCNICISKPCLDILLFLDLIATFLYFMIYGSPVHPVHGFWISSPSLWLSIVSSIIIFPWILLSCLLFFSLNLMMALWHGQTLRVPRGEMHQLVVDSHHKGPGPCSNIPKDDLL